MKLHDRVMRLEKVHHDNQDFKTQITLGVIVSSVLAAIALFFLRTRAELIAYGVPEQHWLLIIYGAVSMLIVVIAILAALYTILIFSAWLFGVYSIEVHKS